MSPPTPAPVRPAREEPEPPEPPQEGGLTVFLWVIAALIALAEVLWWMSDRMFSP